MYKKIKRTVEGFKQYILEVDVNDTMVGIYCDLEELIDRLSKCKERDTDRVKNLVWELSLLQNSIGDIGNEYLEEIAKKQLKDYC